MRDTELASGITAKQLPQSELAIRIGKLHWIVSKQDRETVDDALHLVVVAPGLAVGIVMNSA